MMCVLLCNGCASYHTIDINNIEEVAIEIHEKSRGNTVQLGMYNGEEYFGKELEVKSDSIRIFNSSTMHHVEYSNTDIIYIVTINRKSGGLKGLKVGFIVGFIAAALTYYAVDDISDEEVDHDWLGVMACGACGGVVGGFVWGFPIGWLLASIRQ